MPLSLLLALATAHAITQPPDVLVTGATGRLGSLLYAQAKADTRIGSVRAFVTNVTHARDTLGCQKCDPSEGIYVGDVRNPLGLATLAVPDGALANQWGERGQPYHLSFQKGLRLLAADLWDHSFREAAVQAPI